MTRYHTTSTGNIPFTAEEEAEWDAKEAQYEAVGKKQQLIALYDEALGQLYDKKAREKLYNDRYTCALRAGYPGPFQAEGITFATWMDSCNALGYTILAEVNAGTRPAPTLEEFLGMLPQLSWP